MLTRVVVEGGERGLNEGCRGFICTNNATAAVCLLQKMNQNNPDVFTVRARL